MSTSKAPIDFSTGDDLSDLFGGDVSSATPKTLPTDESFARIRAHGTGEVPAAKLFKVPCKKCVGSGVFRGWSGQTVGPCFTCKGKGSFERKTSPEKLAVSRDRARERKNEVAAAVVADHQVEIAWLGGKLRQNGLPEGYANLLRDLLSRLQSGKELSEGQLGVIRKGQARDAEYAAKKVAEAAPKAEAAAAPGVDASQIMDAIRRGKESGLDWVCLRFSGVVMYEAKNHPGVLYVKTGLRGGTYLGKIANGRFVASRECSPEQAASILLISADPAAAAKVYGFETGACCVCNRKLTNAESVTTGIGPICSGRMGWTPGGLKRTAGVDF